MFSPSTNISYFYSSGNFNHDILVIIIKMVYYESILEDKTKFSCTQSLYYWPAFFFYFHIPNLLEIESEGHLSSPPYLWICIYVILWVTLRCYSAITLFRFESSDPERRARIKRYSDATIFINSTDATVFFRFSISLRCFATVQTTLSSFSFWSDSYYVIL